MTRIDTNPTPSGELSLQTVAMPSDTNARGDIFGGWLLSQMDLAASVAAQKIAHGRVATVAVDSMSFLVPVNVGAVISCYCDIVKVGRSSIVVLVEVWMQDLIAEKELTKVTEGTFVFVAIDDKGLTRAIPKK